MGQVALQLGAAGTARFRVLDPDGRPVDGAAIQVIDEERRRIGVAGLAMTIHDAEGGFSPATDHAPAVRQVRERLVERYGDDGRLTLRDEPPGSAVTVEYPLESASSRDVGTMAPSAPLHAEHVRP